jgi:hypothetical protein
VIVVESVGPVADRLAAYYRSPAVRARMAEYCGGLPMSASGIGGYGGTRRLSLPEGGPVAVPLEMWTRLLSEGADVCRSLSDAKGTLLQIDVDYNDPDDPGQPYHAPEVCFARLEPVYRAIRDVLEHYDIAAAAVMTGRGYHFTTLVPTGSALHDALRCLGSRAQAGASPGAQAHEGAGRLLEFLAHAVVRRAAAFATVPLTLADVPVPEGGPFVCLDLSAWGDPLSERHARCAFSSNQKAGMTNAAADRPFSINLPREEFALEELLAAREDPGEALRLAERAHAWIPETSDAVRLVAEYEASPLGGFHRDFDAGPEIAPDAWRWTYDLLDPKSFPGCVTLPLEHPNPALLQPVFLRSVALTLWAMGWHPRSVAGIIRSRFEHDCGWGDQWRRFDPARRAAFYVRLFCGAVVAGLDGPADFTCESQAGRHVCGGAVRCSVAQKALFESLRRPLAERE